MKQGSAHVVKNIFFRVVTVSVLLFFLSLIAHNRKPLFYQALLKELPAQTGAALPLKAPPPLPDFFLPNEQIVYAVLMGRVSLGEATFIHRESTEFQGRAAHHISFETKLTSFTDYEEIYVDARTLLPLKVQREVRMFPFPEKIVEFYDQEKFSLTIEKTKFKKTRTMVIQKESPIQNAILLPYLVRSSHELSVGWTTKVNLPTQEFQITLSGIEDVKVPAGTFSAFHFESDPPRFEIWISNDKDRVPLKIRGLGGLGYSLVMKERIIP